MVRLRIGRDAPARAALDASRGPNGVRGACERSGRSASVHAPKAGPLVTGILNGRRRAGRRPVLAALALLR